MNSRRDLLDYSDKMIQNEIQSFQEHEQELAALLQRERSKSSHMKGTLMALLEQYDSHSAESLHAIRDLSVKSSERAVKHLGQMNEHLSKETIQNMETSRATAEKFAGRRDAVGIRVEDVMKVND